MASQRGFDRVVNLSDAVVAIAATLLVLPLVDSAPSIAHENLGELLAENRDELIAFALSFAVICRFWLVHHSLFTRLDGVTGPIVWINFVWLFSIAFLPFPTELVSSSGVNEPAVSAALQWLVGRSPELLARGVAPAGIRSSLMATATMVVALIIAVAVPAIGLWAILLLVPSGLIDDRLSRRAAASVT
jgi:uncharacterized membrane protein